MNGIVIAKELVSVARDLVGAGLDPRSIEDGLRTLSELSDNLDLAFDEFGKHYLMAALDPTITSQMELLKKAKDGLENAQTILKAAKNIQAQSPEDKRSARMLKDAEAMVEKFSKHVNDARKVIMTLSKKMMPPSLKKYAKAVAGGIESRLVRPEDLEVIPWQNELYNYDVKMNAILFMVVFKLHTGDKDKDMVLEGTASEWSTGSKGVVFSPRKYGQVYEKAMPVDEAVEEFLKSARGWSGLKGEGQAINERAGVAQQIGSILNRLNRSFGGSEYDEAEIRTGNIIVTGSYRSDLPKEGAFSVGESRYDEMVREEIGRFRKQLDPALSSYMSQIKRVRVYSGEKSWIYTEIELK